MVSPSCSCAARWGGEQPSTNRTSTQSCAYFHGNKYDFDQLLGMAAYVGIEFQAYKK